MRSSKKELPRIGYIAADSRAPTREAFRQGLRDFGYLEGKNILIEWRFADDKLNRFGEFAAELVRLNVDVIVSGNSNAVSVIHRATKRIPIVMATYGGDPVADGLVSSFARPEGNVTGVISLSPELSGKQLNFSRKRSRSSRAWQSYGTRTIQGHGSSGNVFKTLPNPSETIFCRRKCELPVGLIGRLNLRCGNGRMPLRCLVPDSFTFFESNRKPC